MKTLSFEYDPLYSETFEQFGLLEIEAIVRYVDQSFDHEFGAVKSGAYEVRALKIFKASDGEEVTELITEKEKAQIYHDADLEAAKLEAA